MIGSPRQPGLSCVPASFPNLHNAIDLSVLDGERGGDGQRLRLLAAATPYAPSNGGRRRPDGGAHDGVPEVRHAPAAGARDLGDEPAHVEPLSTGSQFSPRRGSEISSPQVDSVASAGRTRPALSLSLSR